MTAARRARRRWKGLGETVLKHQARIQGVGAGARAHPWEWVSPFKMHYSIAFKHQSITGRPPLGEILYPPLSTLIFFKRWRVRSGQRSKLSASAFWFSEPPTWLKQAQTRPKHSKVRRRYCMSVNAILSTGQGQVRKGHYIQKSHCGHVMHVLWPILAIEFDG